MKKIFIGTFFLGLASLGYGQNSGCERNEIKLSDVEVTPANQDYLNRVSDESISDKVYFLEKKASRYNVKKHPLFNANYNGRYRVRFDDGKGEIVATFGRNGKILYTRENYRDLLPPIAIRNSLYGKYLNWNLRSSAYTVNYNGREVEKTYAVRMEKDGVKKKMKFDIEGNILR